MTVRALSNLLTRLSNTRHGNEAQDLRDFLESVFPPQFSGARLIKTADQGPIASGSFVTVTWEATDFDTDSYADLANNRLIIPTTDYYNVSAGVICSGGATTSILTIDIGATIHASQIVDSGSFSPGLSISTGPLLLTASDTVISTLNQLSGRTITSLPRTFLSITRLGQEPA